MMTYAVIWYLIGILAGLLITYSDWLKGHDVSVAGTVIYILLAVCGPVFLLMVLPHLGNITLIKGKKNE